MTNVKDKLDFEEIYELTESREKIYRFLSIVYLEEPNLSLYEVSKSIPFRSPYDNVETDLFGDLKGFDKKQIITELEVEYTRLFIGPLNHISPHESIQRGEGRFWGDYTVEVKKFYEKNGFTLKDDFRGMPDHISIELLFLCNLLKEEKDSLTKKDIETYFLTVNNENSFIKNHLSIWVKEFADKVCEIAKFDYYKVISRFCSDFIKDELLYTENILKDKENVRT